MTRTLSWRLLAALLALLLVAAACGSDDEDSDTETESGAEDTTEETAEETAEADEADSGDTEEAAAADDGYDRTDWPDSLVYGAVPAENAEDISTYVTPQIIADELGIEIEFIQAADYAGVIEGMVAENVDLGGFGGFSYVIATGAGADIDVAGLWSDTTGDGLGDYRSYLITQADNTEINEPADLAGKNVCFVDPGSTSGFLFPSAALLSEGLDPSETSEDITPTFAGGHDASAIAVANGHCDAGFAYDTMVTEQLIDSGDLSGVIDEVEDENVNPDDASVRIIWKSTPIAAPPLAYGNWLPENLREAIIEVVTTKVNVDWAVANGYCESEETCPLADGPFWGYVQGDDSYFDGIRELCELTGSARCEG
ncbi:MAG: phosphate/phosphite/phosphonate ABC transporter substrate-binding protein [Actinomycetota bacterium]